MGESPPFRAFVLTASDSGFRGEREDRSGPEAERLLREAGYVHNITPVIAVSISNKPGGLNNALAALSAAGVNVEYMYAFVGSSGDGAYMIFRVADTEKAGAALCSAGIPLAEQEELAQL